MEAATEASRAGAAELVACLGHLIGADVATADHTRLAELVARSHQLRSWLDAFDVKVAARAADLDQQGSSEPAGDVLRNGGRCSRREAQRTAARADACSNVPGLADALESGKVSSGHVDAVANATAGLDEESRSRFADHANELVDAASRLPVEHFARDVRQLANRLSRQSGESRQQRLYRNRCVKRWIDPATGMHVTHLELDADGDAKLWTAIRAGLGAEHRGTDGNDPRTFDQQVADVVVQLITGSQAVDRRVPEVSVLIDLDTLRDRAHDGTVAETSDGEPVDIETIRRLGCDGDLVGILVGELGVPLAVGRAQRLATREQRQAVRSMYRTCADPGCHVSFDWCRLHHVAWWTRDLGATDLDNLVPLCGVHHHLVHEGGWTLELLADRTVTVYRPDGSVFFKGDTTNRCRHPAGVDTLGDALVDGAGPERPDHVELSDTDKLRAGLAEALDFVIARNREHPPP